MRKFLLSFFVIFTFIFYAVFQRWNDVRPSVSSLNNIKSINSAAKNALNSPPANNNLAGKTVNNNPTKKSAAPKPVARGAYIDGQYVGSVADAYYGSLQVKAIISGGRITDVQFLQYPSDRPTSRMINGQAASYLVAEAISAQSANVDIVSGATDSSMAFRQSMASALAQAKR